MFDLSEKEYLHKLEKIQKRNIQIEYRQSLKKERRKHYPKITLPSTSKLILLGAAFLCLEIIIFCQYIMAKTGDVSAMYSMIGIVASIVPIVLAYYSKSKKENSQGGITYDMAMAEMNKVGNDEALG